MAAKTETLVVERRVKAGSREARRIRRQGRIPAVIYGLGKEALSVSLDARDLDVVIRHHSKIIDLTIDGANEAVLLKDVQYDALGDRLLHVDFSRVDLTKPVKVFVGLELIGTPKGVHTGGILEHHLTDLQVTCLPTRIPEAIVADISGLELGDALHAGQIALPEGVTYEGDPQVVVASVLQPRRGVEEALAEGIEGAPAAEEAAEEGEEKKEA